MMGAEGGKEESMDGWDSCQDSACVVGLMFGFEVKI